MTSDFATASGWLAKSESVFVITGAGISADSGIPTFRGPGGYWRNHDPMDLASPEGFARDPALVWEWYAWRMGLVQSAQPNAGHQALVTIEQRVKHFFLLTQNVDGLHQRAGSRNVHEIHGSIVRQRCTVTGRIFQPGELTIQPPFPIRTPGGHLARPDVVWFGESLPSEVVFRVQEFLSAHPPGLTLVIGTSALFDYIESWALSGRRRGRGKMIEINPDETPLSHKADLRFAQPAAVCLPSLAQAAGSIRPADGIQGMEAK